MPAKKKAKLVAKKKGAVKKAAKKVSPKAQPKKAVPKKAVKKAPPKKPAAKEKPVVVKEIMKAPPRPAPVLEEKIEVAKAPEPPKPKPPKLGIDCEHCDATGICAAGTPYDRSHGQMFGAKVRMTSCPECLEAAGEHSNSKKLVKCRICDGDGKV